MNGAPTKKSQLPWYAVAVAIVVVGALWLGVPLSTLAWLGLVLICPLMMFFMMRGMHGGDGNADRDDAGYGGHAGCGHQADRPQSQTQHDADQRSGR